jgi:MoaA/NifB/PqqE/SkfB family radical SAM enzyme
MYSEFQLDKYLSDGVENIIKGAISASLRNPKESLFITKFALASREAAAIRENYEINGKHIPPFLICSITNSCNLNCKGCYFRVHNENKIKCSEDLLSVEDWKRIFKEAVKLGVSFILIAGGEPFIRKEVIEEAAKFRKIMFPIFTNGTLFNEEYFSLFHKNRNLLPILSVEGDNGFTDSRRGCGIYSNLMSVMQSLKDYGLFFGASITVTRENLNYITSDSFLFELYQKGCKVVFYVEYVPVETTTEHLVLTDEEREDLDRRLRCFRLQYSDMIILSFPGDEKSSGGCLAAGRGFFHINPFGNAEPCPFSPYSDINLKDCTILEALQSPLFKKLTASDILLQEHTGGCVLFGQEEKVKILLDKEK